MLTLWAQPCLLEHTIHMMQMTYFYKTRVYKPLSRHTYPWRYLLETILGLFSVQHMFFYIHVQVTHFFLSWDIKTKSAMHIWNGCSLVAYVYARVCCEIIKLVESSLLVQLGSKMCFCVKLSNVSSKFFMGPTWGPPGADRTQVDPMLATWTWLSVTFLKSWLFRLILFDIFKLYLDY